MTLRKSTEKEYKFCAWGHAGGSHFTGCNHNCNQGRACPHGTSQKSHFGFGPFMILGGVIGFWWSVQSFILNGPPFLDLIFMLLLIGKIGMVGWY